MGNRLPEELIEKVHQSVDIVDIVSEYVQLKKQGRNYFGLCPFHGESTPSFSVSPDKQIFHCFGCGAGGNVFSFLMQIEGVQFLQAVSQVAERTNIELPATTQIPETTGQNNLELQPMIDAHDLLKKFYHHLLVNTKEGQEAYDYLLNRGFSKEVIDKFEIGYSLNSWEFVKKFLAKRGFHPEIMDQAGLLVKKNETNEYFDRFRNRIMFPIHDHHGHVVAFSGRVLGNEQPKYLNSPETKLFNKSKLLYNFHQARVHIRKYQEAVLFEGFADVISAVESGVPNSIATMGTSLTEEQVKVLKRNVSDVIICYDSDQAGREATMRAAKILTKAGSKVKVAVIPDGLDPDDYIKKYGSEKFKQDVIGASVTLMSFKMQYYRKGKNLQDEGDRLKYIEEILKEIAVLESPVEQEMYVKQLSAEFSLSIEVLKDQLSRTERKSQQQQFSKYENKQQQSRKATSSRPKNGLLPAFHNAERMIIAHMLKNSDIAQKILDQIGLMFNIEEHRAIATYLYAYYEEGNPPNVSLFLGKLPNNQLSEVVSNIAMLQINEEVTDQEIADYVKQVLNYQKLLMIKEKETEKLEAERQREFVQAAKIAMEIVHLKRALKS
ncbi:DNA primase [Metabacillus arenae]|uniref:DNA primase n=1 Tax=Metabacillus arenae TaxID=2771434 RepID=A0A926NLF0_9BACI|nr:DNA primase [Metabacillus arenae]MBD1382118.1 DNA primase [Metabacillus arenae]